MWSVHKKTPRPAARRSSQSGKRNVSQTLGSKKLHANALTSGISASVSKNAVSQAISTSAGMDNPFLQRPRGPAVVSSSTSLAANPFLAAQVSRRDRQAQGSGVPPRSYASIVSGQAPSSRAVVGGPIPSFISHGPGSMPPFPGSSSDQFGNGIGGLLQNPFLTPVQQNVGASSVAMATRAPPLLPTNSAVNPFITAPLPPPPPYQTAPPLSVVDANQPFLGGASYSTGATDPQALPHSSETVLHVKNIPDDFNTVSFLKSHFSKYGALKDIKCHPNKKFATVHFKLREHAVLAKRAGRTISHLIPPVSIFWHKDSTPSRRSTTDSNEAPPPLPPPLFPTVAMASGPTSGQQPDATNTALHVKNIPEELNNSPFLRKHFTRFGFVKKIQCFPKRRCATILYAIHEHAVKAKSQGKRLSPSHPPVQIFWHSGRLRAPSISRDPSKPPPPLLSTPPPPFTTTTSLPPSSSSSSSSATVASVPSSQAQSILVSLTSQTAAAAAVSSLGGGGQAKLLTSGKGVVQPSRKDVLQSVADMANKGGGSSSTRLALSGSDQKLVVQKPSVLDHRLGPIAGRGNSSHDGTRAKKRQREDVAWEPGEPGEGGEGGEESDDEVDEGVSEGRGFLSELGNQEQMSGQAMDTIARFAPHGYNLRSLTQQQAYPSQLPQYLAAATTLALPVQAYSIPSLSLPPPPTPKSRSATDICEALSLRDQEIRKRMVKQTSIAEATAIVGTCPDMCPEKERYNREDTRRLSYFEVLLQEFNERGNPRVDHCKAIKEYSGSAADKEEPLPHELRPPEVLRLTMDHLLTTVMGEGEGEGRWGDWYDFIWNRTRAIRKDITQQHLCNQTCVELTEKCARFHILCSYVLCEKDINTFDPKLNNENLNKCLLSLKQFYRDLRTERGEHCPNEAEFCCYDILLHLSEGNVLNFVEEYSAHVRQHPQVKFAVDCALAFDSNNFVKFFKLLRSASFLCACAVHRFFNMVRRNGVRVLNGAHSISKKSSFVSFPLADVARMLAFENEVEAEEFCEQLGLITDGKHVKLTKGGVVFPEDVMVTRHCLQLIDSKTDKSFGEIINGGPLPPVPVHTPYSSFSEQVKPVLRPIEPSPEPVRPVFTAEDVSSVAEEMCLEVVDMESRMAAIESLREAFCAALWSSLLASQTTEVAGESLAEAREEERLKEEEAAQWLCGEVFSEVLATELLAVSCEACRDCQLQAEAMSSAVMATCDSILDEFVSTELTVVVEETVKVVKQEKQEQLEALKKQHLQYQLRKHWIRWRNSFRTRQHIRRSAADIPPLPPLVSLPRQLERLLPLGKRRRVECSLDAASLADCSLATAELLESSLVQRTRAREEFFAAFDLPSLLRDDLMASRYPPTPSHPSHHHTPHIYWALNILHPPLTSLGARDAETLKWIFGKLSYRKPTVDDDVTGSYQIVQRLSLLSTVLSSNPLVGQRRLNCVVKALQIDAGFDVNDPALQIEVSGTSAAIFFVPLPPPNCSTEVFAQHVFQQLTAFVSLLRPNPSIPVLVLASSGMEQDHLAHWIQLKMDFKLFVQQCSVISDVHFSTLSFPGDLSSHHHPSSLGEEEVEEEEQEGLLGGLLWLAAHSPSQPQLYHLPLHEHLEQGLLQHFVPHVLAESKQHRKPELRNHAHRPHPLVGLYNSLVEWLAARVTSRTLQELSWPMADFAPRNFMDRALPPLYWNSHEHFTALREHIFPLLLLPPPPSPHLEAWEGGEGGEGGDWSSRCEECLSYVAEVSLPEKKASVTLLSRVKALLHAHHLEFQKHSLFRDDGLECSIPWDQVIFACIEHILAHLDPDQWVSCCYGHEREFPLPSVWLRAQAETTLARAARTPAHGKKRHERRKSDSYLSTGISGGYFQLSPTVGGANIQREGDLLAGSLLREKALSQTFEAQLQQWVTDIGSSSSSSSSHRHTSQLHTLPPSSHRHTSQLHPLPPSSHEHSEPLRWKGTMEDGIQLLKMKINNERWKDSTDAAFFEDLEF